MFQIIKLFVLILCFHIQLCSFAQQDKSLNHNEGGIPKVAFYELKGDSMIPLTNLKRAEVTTVYCRVVEGMENVLFNQILSSNDAIVEKSTEERNVYHVTPTSTSVCELILDVKLMEDYYQIAFELQGKRMIKKVIRIYTPRTYMIDYKLFPIID
ncbi:hypothetical protein [uncultured Cytophaga sp.]|uniref:hypothetical protein n=1 Tax=uncultured Cytophaga sp. TaxID=160238 RepID=UPI002624A316|nr:hypothetical protein [uncultured Cytophaga sp.]